MIEAIKEIIKNYINSMKPTRLVFGKVETVAPLAVRVNEKLLIPSEMFVWPPVLTQYDIGKKVLMIQQEGGQQYYILEVR
ncbi:DUF2577 family protein [Petroclostridium xylanilyticum]|jgi:hypothetical protein|uniref:DUF2577 family protein n=1 Tax=Petroclostridium xylanilyticum TaxID=1792311 RepID=UPI000B985EF5|nr:DUF2577 family protein [Petroclostridium xylanilyticum]